MWKQGKNHLVNGSGDYPATKKLLQRLTYGATWKKFPTTCEGHKDYEGTRTSATQAEGDRTGLSGEGSRLKLQDRGGEEDGARPFAMGTNWTTKDLNILKSFFHSEGGQTLRFPREVEESPSLQRFNSWRDWASWATEHGVGLDHLQSPSQPQLSCDSVILK